MRSASANHSILKAEGAHAIAAADSELTLFNKMLKGNDDENKLGIAVLTQFVVHGVVHCSFLLLVQSTQIYSDGLIPIIMRVILSLHAIATNETAKNRDGCAKLIQRIAEYRTCLCALTTAV